MKRGLKIFFYIFIAFGLMLFVREQLFSQQMSESEFLKEVQKKAGSSVNDIRVDSSGNIFISNQDGGVCQFSSEGTLLKKNEFNVSLVGILIDRQDNLCLVFSKFRSPVSLDQDYYVAHCDKDFQIINQYVLEGIGNIMRVEMDPDGNVYALDNNLRVVKKFNNKGKLEDTFGSKVFEFTVDRNQNVYLVEGSWSESRSLLKVSPGKQQTVITTIQGVPFGLCDISADAEGNVYMCGLDYGVKRMGVAGQEFIFEGIGSRFSTQSYPQRVVVDDKKRICVIGSLASEAYIFDPEGRYQFEVRF